MKKLLLLFVLALTTNSTLLSIGIVESNSGISITDPNKQLHLAAKLSSHEKILTALGNGAEIDASDDNDWTALHFAARSGNLEVVLTLLNHGANVNAITNDGQTALHIAAIFNHPHAVTALLAAKGCCINATDSQGSTPLHFATDYNFSTITLLLLAAGADVTVKTEPDQNSAVSAGTALHLAASQGNLLTVRLLLRFNADVNAMTDLDKTALHFAAEVGNKAIVLDLLKAGANVHAVEYENWTARDYAVENGHLGVVEVIDQWIADHPE